MTNKTEKNITKLERITHQLSLIDDTNKMIDMCREGNDNLGVRQYKHLKKKLILNLTEMLAKEYQIKLLPSKAA